MTLYYIVCISLAVIFAGLAAWGMIADRKPAGVYVVMVQQGFYYQSGSLSTPNLTEDHRLARAFMIRKEAEIVADVIGGTVGVLHG